MDLLLERVTPAALTEPGPSADILQHCLEAANAAPDHGRLRPWRFIVIEGAARQKFGDVLASALQQRDPAALPEAVEKERAKAHRAPLIVVIAAVIVPGKIPEIEQVLAAGAAAQNFQLAIHAAGFGCQWKSGAPCYDNTVKLALGLQPDGHLIGFMYVGSIATKGRPRAPFDPALVRRWP